MDAAYHLQVDTRKALNKAHLDSLDISGVLSDVLDDYPVTLPGDPLFTAIADVAAYVYTSNAAMVALEDLLRVKEFPKNVVIPCQEKVHDAISALAEMGRKAHASVTELQKTIPARRLKDIVFMSIWLKTIPESLFPTPSAVDDGMGRDD